MKLILKEAFDDEEVVSDFNQVDNVSINDPDFDLDTLLKDDTIPDQVAFIDSDELNELRDILYNLPTDIHLLLLNNDCIIIVKETDDNKTMVYCLSEDSSEFEFIELPNKLVDILSNNNIIKYLPDQTYEDHEKVVSLFSKDLPEGPEEPEEETIEDNIPDMEKPNGDEDLDFEDSIDNSEEGDEDGKIKN